MAVESAQAAFGQAAFGQVVSGQAESRRVVSRRVVPGQAAFVPAASGVVESERAALAAPQVGQPRPGPGRALLERYQGRKVPPRPVA